MPALRNHEAKLRERYEDKCGRKDYRWSGYGEALGGGRRAREGISRLLETDEGSPIGWNAARLTYRMLLYDRGEALGVDEKGRPIRS